MKEFGFRGRMKYIPELDKSLRPIILDNNEYLKAVNKF